MNPTNNPYTKINFSTAIRLLVWFGLISAGTAAYGGSVFTWNGAAGDFFLQDTNNWSPVTVGRPSSSLNDTLQWNGSIAGNLLLTNITGGTFDSNPGFYVNVTSGQTGSVTISESNTFTGRIRLNGTNTFNTASGAGAFSFGNGGSVPLPIALAGKGTGEIHTCTNNSANTDTFNSDVYYVMGGGGAHTLLLAGTGNWQVNSSLQAQNSGGSLALTVSGPGTVNLVGAPVSGIAYVGTYGNVTVNSGTLQLGAAGAIGSLNTLVLTGGNLDSSVADLVNSGNNAQSWNGNFGFIGTQNLNLGAGAVTMNASRIVTVTANTLTVGGGIAGVGFSLTKAGGGTLVLNGTDTYTGGTVVSNGVLQLGNSSAIPTGTAAAESVTVNGTLDLNGNSPTISSMNGTNLVAAVDTISGGTPTLTVGDQNASSAFKGAIQNTAGSLTLSKTGTGSFTLGGASSYSGGTTVGNGTLLVTNTTGSGTGSGTVTVSSGATLGGTGTVGGSVNWQSGSFAAFTQGSPLTVNGSAIFNGNTITINVPGVTPLGVGHYNLMTYNNSGSSGSFSTAVPTFTGAGISAGTVITITNGNGLVALTVVSSSTGISGVWTNLGNGNWTVGANWSSNPQFPHKAGDAATFGFGSAFTTVTLDGLITSAAVTFTNTNSFAIANAGNTLTFDNTNGGAALIVTEGTSNSIAAPVSLNDNLAVSVFSGASMAITNVVSSTSPSLTLTVAGAGTLALAGNNTYGPPAGSVGTTMGGSSATTLELDNNNALSAGDLSVLTSGTIRAGTPLTVANNIMIITGATASLNNNGNNAALSGVISGGGAFAKNGAGTLILNNANSYNGTTSISAGTIQLGNAGGIPGGGTGNGDVNMGSNTVLDVNGLSPVLNGLNAAIGTQAIVDSLSGGAVTLTLGENGDFGTFYGNIQDSSGSLALVKDGAGNQTLAGTNTYTGGTTINAGLLRVGNGNTNAAAGLGTGSVTDNGTLEFNVANALTFTNSITGDGQLNLANTNLTLTLAASNSFTGNINVNDGILLITNATSLGIGPKNVVATTRSSEIALQGTVTLDPSLTFFLSNDGGAAGPVVLPAAIVNVSGTNTILGPIIMPFGGGVPLVVVSNGYLIIAGPSISSDGNANSRILTLTGAGGLISAPFVDNNSQTAFPQVNSGVWTFTGASTTVGTMTTAGGTAVFNGSWSAGAVVSSGGTLTGTGAVSNLTVNAGGKFVPGAYGSVGSFTVSNVMTLAGTMYASLNKSLTQSNTIVTVVGTGATNLTASSGSSLVISNLGPALVAGDTFYLFSQAVTNGNLISITAPSGVTFTNNLAVNGSISVVPTTATYATNSTISVVGSQVIVSWPADHTGWYLQAQTNTPATGPGTNWVTIPGSNASDSYTDTLAPTNGSVFYRMVYP